MAKPVAEKQIEWTRQEMIDLVLINTNFYTTGPVTIDVARRVRNALSEALGDHIHADPCDDESCPCRKAEADSWRDHGAVRH